MFGAKAADPRREAGDIGWPIARRDARSELDEGMAPRVALPVEGPSLADREFHLDHRFEPVDVALGVAASFTGAAGLTGAETTAHENEQTGRPNDWGDDLIGERGTVSETVGLGSCWCKEKVIIFLAVEVSCV